jgi:hypothetical protein
LGTYSWNNFEVKQFFSDTFSLLWLAWRRIFCRAAASLVVCRLACDDRRAAEDVDWATLRREVSKCVLHQRVDPSPGWAVDAPAEDEADDDCINLH